MEDFSKWVGQQVEVVATDGYDFNPEMKKYLGRQGVIVDSLGARKEGTIDCFYVRFFGCSRIDGYAWYSDAVKRLWEV